jgi:LPS export ABC transporter protein LptC
LLSLFLLTTGEDNHESPSLPGSFLEDVKVVNQRIGKEQWSLVTKKATISEDGDTASLQDVTVRLPAEEMTVEADSGLYNILSRDLALTGNITAVTDSYVIKTESANLTAEKGELSTDDRVVVESRGFRIEGHGLRAAEKKSVRLLRDVKALFF